MLGGITLKDFQKGQMVAYKNKSKSVREIACTLPARPNAISNFIRNPDISEKRRKTGRPKKLMPRDKKEFAHELGKSSRNSAKA